MINISTGKFACFSFAFFSYIEFCCWMGRKLGLIVKSSRIHSIEQTALSKIEKEQSEFSDYIDQMIKQQDQLFSKGMELTEKKIQRQIRLNIRFNNIEKEQAEIRAEQAEIRAEQAEIRAEQAEITAEQAEIRAGQAENKKNRKRNKKCLKVIEQRTEELGVKLANLKANTDRFISSLRERKISREREN
jgi:septal ring factor EnvC (AmiA/AmiB activator)